MSFKLQLSCLNNTKVLIYINKLLIIYVFICLALALQIKFPWNASMLFLDIFPPRPMCLLENGDSCGDSLFFFFFVYTRVGGKSNAVLPTENEKIIIQWEIWKSVRWRKMYILHEQLFPKHILDKFVLQKGKMFG